MMTSPTIDRKSLTERKSLVPTSGDDSIPVAVNIYVTTESEIVDKAARDALKRSMAKASFAK